MMDAIDTERIAVAEPAVLTTEDAIIAIMIGMGRPVSPMRSTSACGGRGRSIARCAQSRATWRRITQASMFQSQKP